MRNRITLSRNAIGLTVSELAQRLNVSPDILSAWENGSLNPSLDQVVEMANFFGLPVDFLFCAGKLEHIPKYDG